MAYITSVRLLVHYVSATSDIHYFKRNLLPL